ncbi:hypothetical protein Hden_2962 [Hyphomicrobium denitrificans ATCC 51888]|uniref:Uncharacterized protein n=1 Tax=Hyphomicrobium denitrificans (strain ATCC 51888 / DSM 1869 / NCIMB 11706 / TK 0415) TaxID=582899 RepID=D8JVA3_HYPDA|nr:phage tail protein [Hyphomicrobium denitrificans]ADJ24757.1 hypothetical protein Hden_2962 [Hyphomicrobium denitrificans ATCC 51888]
MSDRIEIAHRPAGLPVPWQPLPVPCGASLADIVEDCYGTVDGIAAWVQEPDGSWRRVPAELWSQVRPRRSGCVRFTYRPSGGKGGNIFGVIAAIALAIVAPYIGGYIAGTLLGLTGTTLTIASGAIGAGVAIGGSIALTKLFPPDSANFGRQSVKESNAYQSVSSDGNVLAKSAYLPLVVGRRRISPPDIMRPRSYIEDGIETIDRCLAFYGRHALTDVWVDGTPADGVQSLTIEIKDGSEAAGVYTFIDEISAPIAISEELSTFKANATKLEDAETPSNSEPRWHAFSTPAHEKLEEIAIRIRVDGFATSASATQKLRIPIRIRFRIKGTEEWNNLPEMHVIGRSTSTIVRDVRLRWDEDFGAPDIDGELEWQFWQEVPASGKDLSDGNSGKQWEGHPWFDGGVPLTSVNHITAQRFGIRAFLDESVFPKGEFEFQVMRGLALNNDALDTAYKISGTVYSLFVSYDAANVWTIPVDQGGFLARVTPLQATSIATRHPTEWPETAIVALKSKGNSVRNVTVLASRYVLDWDGSAWAAPTPDCANPATHYRQLLHDFLTFYGVDTSLIDDAAFVAWRQECIDQGYECSAVFAGDTVGNTLDAIATAGFARPRLSDGFGIDYFRDRTNDVPVQTFSHRNGEEISFSIVLPERPSGYRVSYQNQDNQWRDDEVEVSLDNASDIQSLESVQYKAIAKTSLVRRRAYFDLLQTDLRRRQWIVQTSVEGIVCERGDLVSVVTDLFDDKSHGARIRQVIDATHLAIDQVIPGVDPGPDIGDDPTVEQIFTTAGDRSVAFIHTPSGIVQREIVNILESVIEIDEALPEADVVGAHINITTLSNARHRCFVVDIDRSQDERAKLTLVDEMPEINQIMRAKFG